jgi:hypothetical protein
VGKSTKARTRRSLAAVVLGIVLATVAILQIRTSQRSRQGTGHPLDSEKIDIVYLWCDGNDPAFRERRRLRGMKVEVNEDSNLLQVDNDELKYSLRSLEKFAPWINHIFIVTDRQVPSWLDSDNKKITIVDHSQILEEGAIPTFSSPAIESRIHNIDGLSEYFLYANDDMFFGAPVGPRFFFDGKGNPIVRGIRIRPASRGYLMKFLEISKDSMYQQTILYSLLLVLDKFGKVLAFYPHHNIDAYRKSYVKDTFSLFREEYDKLIDYPFRERNTLQRVVLHSVDYVKGRASLREEGGGPGGRFLTTILPSLVLTRESLFMDNRFFSSGKTRLSRGMRYLLKNSMWPLFCLNDRKGATEEDRRLAREFLEEMFPGKSSFEK